MRAFVAVAALAACQLSPQAQVDDMAAELCRCFEPEDATCAAQIAGALPSPVPSACVQCVFDDQRTCAAMIDDCTSLCFQRPPGIRP
jgi:hypothetical protein